MGNGRLREGMEERGRNDRSGRLNVGKRKEEEERKGRGRAGMYTAIQTLALFAITREYSKHGRVHYLAYTYTRADAVLYTGKVNPVSE
jgi:hypothetical protein